MRNPERGGAYGVDMMSQVSELAERLDFAEHLEGHHGNL
jgi:hypothetical protein